MTTQTIIHGDCRDMPPNEITNYDVMITDPPYSHEVHTKAVSCTGSKGVLSNARVRDLGFDCLTPELREWIGQAAVRVKRWSVIYSDIESTHLMRESCRGATYIRTLAWIRWSMPQLSGDRPPSSREDLLIFHGHLPGQVGADPVSDLILHYGTAKGKKAWNGPGNLTHLQHKCLRGEGKHRAEKPLDQALDLVSWFSNIGETVLDPFAGSGTIGLACRILGRNYIGYEVDEKWATFASERIANPELSPRDKERLKRWHITQSMRKFGDEGEKL